MTAPGSPLPRDFPVRLLRAGLATGIVDGLFSSALSAFAYGSTVERLFQGVASVVIGSRAFEGGRATAALGLLLHVLVAFAWSAVFLLVVGRRTEVGRLLASPLGTVKVAALYGPAIWMVMSLGVIPLLTQRPPNLGFRWWVQFFGHIPFVGLPIVALSRGRGADTGGPGS